MATASGSKAFERREGQFVCHIYATVPDGEPLQCLEDILNSVINLQPGWKPLLGGADGEPAQAGPRDEYFADPASSNPVHVTLLRGHRAIYYHQIKPLVAALQEACRTIRPLNICLDTLRLFSNFENTKQFLCLATNELVTARHEDLLRLKTTLREAVDSFALKLTDEDETQETLAHVSLMSRDLSPHHPDTEHPQTLGELVDECERRLGEIPDCFIRLGQIHIRIGNHEYKADLDG